MTPEEFLAKMKQIEAKYGEDVERVHATADDLLCEALESLGYKEGLRVYEGIHKWFGTPGILDTWRDQSDTLSEQKLKEVIRAIECGQKDSQGVTFTQTFGIAFLRHLKEGGL